MEDTSADYVISTSSKEKHLSSVVESLSASNRELNSIRIKIEKRIKFLKRKEKKLHNFNNNVMKELDLKKNELALANDSLKECLKVVELKEKIFVSAFNSPREVNCSDGNIRCVVEMDAYSVLKFLNEHEKDADCDVTRLLQLSPDPAKLVVDAMKWFYPCEEDTGIERAAVRRSCIVLLKELIGLKPKVRAYVKEAVSKVACEWKAKMSHESLDVLGFLYLLAAYGLVSAFAAGEVFNLLESVAYHKETPKLLECLGFRQSVPDLIIKLIEKQQLLQALRYIHAFQLMDYFPAGPLLDIHLACSEALAKKFCDEGYNSSAAARSTGDIHRCIADQRDKKTRRSCNPLDEDTSDNNVIHPPKKSKECPIILLDSPERAIGSRVDDYRPRLKEVDTSAECHDYPDPEFSDFGKDRSEKAFAAGQIWACYDSIECMPRDYALVSKILSPGFKLQVEWLTNLGNKCLSCGTFTPHYSEEVSEVLVFSHQAHFLNYGKHDYLILPTPGETWALFKPWENNKKNKYEIVVVLPSAEVEGGFRVDYLKRVEGFISLFQRSSQELADSFLISSSELNRFSHRIPSVKLTGKEREGVPKGSFELDPASLPTDLDNS